MDAHSTDLKCKALAALERYWRHSAFRPGQWEVIESVLQGQDVLAVLPTGAGKSVCYQLPAVLSDGLTLVVSPLIALMQDQVAALNARGIPSAFINSTLSPRAVEQCWTDAEFGRYKLLYLAPERLKSDVFLARARRLNVRLVAVDEAHCVSEWGHHFRPAYLDIAIARTALGSPPMMATTATATAEVRRDIIEQLHLRAPRVIIRGFDRPNITWSIFHQGNKREKLQDVLRTVPGSGIIYTVTRRGAESWAEWLGRQGEQAAAYHGGMPAEKRAAVQDAWLQDALRVVVATNAFGLGVDKPDVRFVVHVDLPGSVEMYYQEAGRAGRDGKKAHAVLLWGRADEETQRTLLAESHPDAKAVQEVYKAVANLAQIPLGTRPDKPIVLGYEAVARLTGYTRGKIKGAVDLLERQGTWAILPPRSHAGHIRFLQPIAAIRKVAVEQEKPSIAEFIQALLRTVPADAFSGWWELDLRTLERRVRLTRERLLRGLAFLKERGLIDWNPPGEDFQVIFNQPRQARVRVEDRNVRQALQRAEARLDGMLRYAGSTTCRRRFLLSYFGEESPPACGNCDVCLGRHDIPVITSEDEPAMRHILEQASAGIPRTAWSAQGLNGRHVDSLVHWLVQEGYLRICPHDVQQLAPTDKAHDFMDQWIPRV